MWIFRGGVTWPESNPCVAALSLLWGKETSSLSQKDSQSSLCHIQGGVHEDRTDHEAGLERPLEGEGRWTHAARAAQVRVVGAGCHSYNALRLGRLPTQEVILVFSGALKHNEPPQAKLKDQSQLWKWPKANGFVREYTQDTLRVHNQFSHLLIFTFSSHSFIFFNILFHALPWQWTYWYMSVSPLCVFSLCDHPC